MKLWRRTPSEEDLRAQQNLAFFENRVQQYVSKTDPTKEEAQQFAQDLRVIDFFQQVPVMKLAARWGILVPDTLKQPTDILMVTILTNEGVAWVKQEARRQQLTYWKDIVAILSPLTQALLTLISLLIAAGSLYFTLRKR